jgi:hypothetical protein
MDLIDNIHAFPAVVKRFILLFVLTLSVGYFTGFKFIKKTTELSPSGIEQNYNGNEADEEAAKMMFKKSESEILTTIHTHILSFSLIFFSLGLVLLTVPMHASLKNFLLIEPFISIILTFGGIWLLWKDVTWVKYIVMVSGSLLTITFTVSVLLVVRAVLRVK